MGNSAKKAVVWFIVPIVCGIVLLYSWVFHAPQTVRLNGLAPVLEGGPRPCPPDVSDSKEHGTDKPMDLHKTARSGGSVVGSVCDIAGAPVLSPLITVFSRSFDSTTNRTDSDGARGASLGISVEVDSTGGFEIPELPVGRYTLVAETKVQIGYEDVEVPYRDSVEIVRLLVRDKGLLHGRVVGLSGAAVSGAEVRIAYSCDGPRVNLLDSGFVTETTDDGRFQFAVSSNSYRLFIEASGFAPTYTAALRTGLREHIVSVAPGFSVEGTVRGITNSGQPEVILRNVDLRLLSGEEFVATNGSFAFSNVPEGTYYLHAVQSESISDPITVSVKKSIKGLVLSMEPCASISGCVYDKDNPNEGIEGAVVCVRPLYPSRLKVESLPTDSGGFYRLGSLLPGEYSVEILPTKSLEYASRMYELREEVQLQRGENMSHNIGVKRGCYLRGVVRFQDAAEASNARVSIAVTEPTGKRRRFATYTDGKGTFETYGIPADSLIWCFAEHRQSVSKTIGPIQVFAPGNDSIVLVLDEKVDSSVAGTVLDGRMEPVPIQLIAVSGATSGASRHYLAWSGYDGRFVFPSLPSGSYELFGQAPGDLRRFFCEVSIPQSRDVNGLRLIYESSARNVVESMVVDEHGEPIAGAVATIMYADGVSSDLGFLRAASSDSDGLYTLRVSPDEAVYVVLTAEGYFDSQAVLEPGAPLTPTVLRRRDGASIE